MDRILAAEEQAFGIWLGRELAERGWSQSDFAARLAPYGTATGSKQSHVSKWLHGQRHPGRRSCAAIAAALGLPLATVLAQAGRSQPDGLADGPVCTRLVALVRAQPEEQLARVAPVIASLLQAASAAPPPDDLGQAPPPLHADASAAAD